MLPKPGFLCCYDCAKSGLYFQWGERGKWFGLQNYAGKQEKPYLEGSMRKYLAGQGLINHNMKQGCRIILRKGIADDRISIKNRAIIHGKMKIGLLASTVKIKTWDECVTHYRSPVDENSS